MGLNHLNETKGKKKTAPAPRAHARDHNVGLPARRAAVALLGAVLKDAQPLDEALVSSRGARLMDSMAVRDRALARAIASTTLRRMGQLDAVLNKVLDKGLPKKAGPLHEILLTGACQILFLDTPDHAAIDLAVTLAKQDRKARHFDKLVNAVLRKAASQGPGMVAGQNAERLNTPDWLWQRWTRFYGDDITRRIAGAHLKEAALDLTVKTDPEGWAEMLGGIALATGSVRLASGGRVETLPGFDTGDWWVQDAAAALPARLLGDVTGKRVADLCAAPGGKTAQLAHAGARVTAVDVSGARLERLRDNLNRLGLDASVVTADVLTWDPGETFDAVLLDAPCTGTGTLRRHPDIGLLKSAHDLEELSKLQARLLRRAAALVAPGGTLVYCTCSLEPEEGENQIARLLEDCPPVSLDAIRCDETGGQKSWINQAGQLRTLPFDLDAGADAPGGVDGFFAARLKVGA